MRLVQDVRELVDLVDLKEVTLLRVAGERVEDAAVGDETEPTESLQVFNLAHEDNLEVRCVLEMTTSTARLLADVSSRYVFSEPLQVPEDVMKEFTARVGVMAVFPFLREAIHQTATRLQVPVPVLGLLKANQVELQATQDGAQPTDVPTLGD